MSAVDRLAELLRTTPGIKVAVGLTRQGHMPTVQKMLAEGFTWNEIGNAIGWHAPTAERWYHLEQEIIAMKDDGWIFDRKPTKEELCVTFKRGDYETFGGEFITWNGHARSLGSFTMPPKNSSSGEYFPGYWSDERVIAWHHLPDPPPGSCRCPTWTQVCGDYIPAPSSGNCGRCGHKRECHQCR